MVYNLRQQNTRLGFFYIQNNRKACFNIYRVRIKVYGRGILQDDPLLLSPFLEFVLRRSH